MNAKTPVSALIRLDTGEDIKIRDIIDVVDTSVATAFIYRYTYYDEEGMHTLMKSYTINNNRIVYIKADLSEEEAED